MATAVSLLTLLAASCTTSGDEEAVYDGSPGEAEPGELAATDAEGEADSVDTDDFVVSAEDLIVEDPQIYDLDSVPEVDLPDLDGPDDVLPELDTEISSAVVEAVESPEVDILDVAGVVDDGPTAEEIAGFGDGNRRQPSGELIALDDSASLACANTELALFAIDDGDLVEAADQAFTASERAAGSESPGVADWADALAASVSAEGQSTSVDATVLVGFLGVCVEGGHAL